MRVCLTGKKIYKAFKPANRGLCPDQPTQPPCRLYTERLQTVIHGLCRTKKSRGTRQLEVRANTSAVVEISFTGALVFIGMEGGACDFVSPV